MIEVVKTYLSKGYSIIPVTKDKNPAIDSWGKYIYNPIPVDKVPELFKNADGIALLMGGKKKLTTIDIDLKYDLTGTLFDRLKKEIGSKLLSKLCCHSTRNKGYHLIFSCEKVEAIKN